MSQDNRPNYGAPPAGGAYPNNAQPQYPNQQNQYASYEIPNAPADPNQPLQNYPQQTQNPGTAPPASYPPGQPGSYERSQPALNHSTYPPQNYPPYAGSTTAPPPQPPPYSQPNAQFRPEASAQNYPGQPQFTATATTERQQNTFSHHETSAPVGAAAQQNFQNQRMEGSARNDPNFPAGAQPGQYRGEVGQPQYGQPPGGDYGRQANAPAPNPTGVSTDAHVIGGFLGQSSNQPNPAIPGGQLGQPTDPSRGGMQEPNPGFNFAQDINNAPGGAPPGGNPPMGLNMTGQSNDAQSMDIGALNRMAEYYATNSDYPKVSFHLKNIFRLLNTLRK